MDQILTTAATPTAGSTSPTSSGSSTTSDTHFTMVEIDFHQLFSRAIIDLYMIGVAARSGVL
jgi:hypothetical protein